MSWLCAVGVAAVLAGVFDSCATAEAERALVAATPAPCAAPGSVSWLAAGDRLEPAWAGLLAAPVWAPGVGAAVCAVAPGLVDGAASTLTGADVDGAGDVA